MNEKKIIKPIKNQVGLDSEDYYYENGFMVFTEAYHLKRGYCCKNSCKNCPYSQKKK